jgi:phosphatidylserine/phosphatidylglycerophosphate/cardiolipin synthase-like enzyme
MPSLDELKNKWFIPMAGDSPDDIPQRRHTEDAGENTLTVSTDGNTVTPLLDGQAFMREWHNRLAALTPGTTPELYHAGWRYEGVRTLGAVTGTTNALEDVLAGQTGGAATYVLVCRNIGVWEFNRPSILWLRDHGVDTSCQDNRFPTAGSNHQKCAIFKDGANTTAILGSIDISMTRWDTPAHRTVEPERDATGRPTHDTGVAVAGPAVLDLQRSYRERWNDPTRTLGMIPLWPPQPLISTPLTPPAAGGSHSVQVLRTYGVTSEAMGYSWSPRGEFTVWASHLNAIKRATNYIYIEDQYFLPFDWPPCFSRTGHARDTDIIYQLGEAMKRGVNVVVLTPNNAEDAFHRWQKYQRDVGINYLNQVRTDGAPGRVVVSALHNGTDHVYIHSKLMIVDDEFVSIGSTNVGQRSMTHDGELHVGVVDSANLFAKELRKSLWAEHTQRAVADFDDVAAGLTQWIADTAASHGHLQPYDLNTRALFPRRPGSAGPPIGHADLIRDGIDPYAGPAGIR